MMDPNPRRSCSLTMRTPDWKLSGGITFTPRSNGYEFTERTRFDRLFDGFFVPVSAMPDYIKALVGDRRGLEAIDAEYSRVLERAQKNGQRVAFPPGFVDLCTGPSHAFRLN